jgi:hypothetical protein
LLVRLDLITLTPLGNGLVWNTVVYADLLATSIK